LSRASPSTIIQRVSVSRHNGVIFTPKTPEKETNYASQFAPLRSFVTLQFTPKNAHAGHVSEQTTPHHAVQVASFFRNVNPLPDEIVICYHKAGGDSMATLQDRLKTDTARLQKVKDKLDELDAIKKELLAEKSILESRIERLQKKTGVK